MSWTFCTSGQAIVKAGSNANSTITASNQALADWSDEIEAIICDVSRVDLVTNYASLKIYGKKVLQNITASYIAQQIVSYDMGAYGSRRAETKADLLENDIQRGLKWLEDDNIKAYLEAT